MAQIVGNWKVEQGPFAGLVYRFNGDNTFRMEMAAHGVHASGTYALDTAATPNAIDIVFKEHTAPSGLGTVKGICEPGDKQLKMKLGAIGAERWTDPAGYVAYSKA